MKTIGSLYQLTRADFFERTRRYSFLITIGLTIYLAYMYLPPANAGYLGFAIGAGGEIRGMYNSAWIGGVIAVLCSTVLILPGFYLVKNAISRDFDTRVGEIIATTPVSKWGYTAGKTLSNFAFLVTMVGVIALAGIVMQLVRGESSSFALWAYLSPFLFSTLPVMFVIAALAVLFEVIPWLRAGFGNIVYAVLWIVMLISTIMLSESHGILRPTNDPLGMTAIVSSMLDSARQIYPEVESGFAIGGVQVQGQLQTFSWTGMHWTAGTLLGRLLWIGVGVGFSILAALLFNRFDPATERGRHKKKKRAVQLETGELPEIVAPLSSMRLTSLETRRGNFISLFLRTLLAEIRLMMKGVGWWWYLVALGLVIACVIAPLQITWRYLLPVAWVWPILLWSAMGTREVRYRTGQIVFSTAHPLRIQLPAAWCAGWLLALAIGAGAAVRLAAAGEQEALLAWMVGSLFIPSLALACGVWSGSSKLFEVVYILLWYVGPINGLAALDFTGANGTSGLEIVYLGASAVLLTLAFLGRMRRIE